MSHHTKALLAAALLSLSAGCAQATHDPAPDAACDPSPGPDDPAAASGGIVCHPLQNGSAECFVGPHALADCRAAAPDGGCQ